MGVEHLLHLFDSPEHASSRGGEGSWVEDGEGEDRRFEDYDDEFDENDPRSHLSRYRRRLLAHLPADLLKVEQPSKSIQELCAALNSKFPDEYYEATPIVTPDWQKWAERAGFDEWERLVLDCMVSKNSREKALAEQPNETSRKALQAAWKRVQRTGMDRLREAVKKISLSKMSRKRHFQTLDN